MMQGTGMISGNFSTRIREGPDHGNDEAVRTIRRSGFVGINSKVCTRQLHVKCRTACIWSIEAAWQSLRAWRSYFLHKSFRCPYAYIACTPCCKLGQTWCLLKAEIVQDQSHYSQESEADFLGLDEYNAFVFKVHGDGRNYIANLRTDNWITGGQSHDVWQAALLTKWDFWCALVACAVLPEYF